jgi:hypothetical protein
LAFPGSEELIAAAEQGLGRRLPDGYRARLLRENSGEIVVEGDSWSSLG